MSKHSPLVLKKEMTLMFWGVTGKQPPALQEKNFWPQPFTTTASRSSDGEQHAGRNSTHEEVDKKDKCPYSFRCFLYICTHIHILTMNVTDAQRALNVNIIGLTIVYLWMRRLPKKPHVGVGTSTLNILQTQKGSHRRNKDVKNHHCSFGFFLRHAERHWDGVDKVS